MERFTMMIQVVCTKCNNIVTMKIPILNSKGVADTVCSSCKWHLIRFCQEPEGKTFGE